jgi:hypothetical protein
MAMMPLVTERTPMWRQRASPSLAVLLLLAQVLVLVRGQVVQAGVRQRLVVPVPVHRMVAKVTGPASALELIAQSRH